MIRPMAERGARYSIVYRATDPQTGHMNQVSTWEWEAKSAVEEALAGIVTQLGGGTYLRPNEQTVKQFLEDDWVPSLDVAVAGGRYKQSTAESHRLHARYPGGVEERPEGLEEPRVVQQFVHLGQLGGHDQGLRGQD